VVNAGRLLDRDTIFRSIWADVVVTEDAITQCVREVRRALSDEAQTIIKTVPRRGYVFAADVTKLADKQSTAPAAAEVMPLPDKPSIAVLPFQNISSDPEQEYFADGMVEEIITGLSRVRSFFVIARNSSFTYKGRAVDVKQVGRELGVRYVLEGSVRKAGNRVRISGKLVDALNGVHLWAERFDSELGDVFDLQDRVTTGVVSAIEPTIRSAEIKRAQHKPTDNLQAYDLLLRALPHIYSCVRERHEEAINLLRWAIDIDPTYASAFARLAWCLYLRIAMGWTRAAEPELKEAVRLARIAVEHGGLRPRSLCRCLTSPRSPCCRSRTSVATPSRNTSPMAWWKTSSRNCRGSAHCS
jgi:TolB-like protein